MTGNGGGGENATVLNQKTAHFYTIIFWVEVLVSGLRCAPSNGCRAYLERLEGLTNLPRVGLKQLASTPVAPPPEGFSDRHPAVEHESGCKVLRIGDLDDHLGISTRLAERKAVAWRVQRRPVARFDDLVSTFGPESRVAFVAAGTDECVLSTEQLVILCFHHRADGSVGKNLSISTRDTTRQSNQWQENRK